MALDCEQMLKSIFESCCNVDGSSKISTLQADVTKILSNQKQILDNQKALKDVLIVDNINQIEVLKNNTKFLVNQDGTSNLKFKELLDLLRDPNSSSSYIKELLEENKNLKIDGEHLLFTIYNKIGVSLPFKPSTIFEAIDKIEVNPIVNVSNTSINNKIDELKELTKALNNFFELGVYDGK